MLCNGYWWGWTQLQQPSVATYCNHRTKWNFAGRYSLLQDDVIAKDNEMIVVIEMVAFLSWDSLTITMWETTFECWCPVPDVLTTLLTLLFPKWAESLSLLLCFWRIKTHSKHKLETKCWTDKCWTVTPSFFWVQPYVSTGATERFLEFWTWQLYSIVQWSF